MKSLIKSTIILSELVKAFFKVIFQFLFWTFTNPVALLVFAIIIISAFSWSSGFLLYVKNINQTRNEIFSETPDISTKTDAIVVLTGGSERIKHAIFLLNLGYADKLFVSGVNKEVKLNELLVLHGYSSSRQPALASRIELGYSAIDTIQNAEEIAAWAKRNNIKSIRLVTSNYHMKRAVLEISDELPDVKIIPHSVIPINIRIDRWWSYPPTRDLLLSEYNKYLAANLRIFLEKFRH